MLYIGRQVAGKETSREVSSHTGRQVYTIQVGRQTCIQAGMQSYRQAVTQAIR